MLCILNDQFLSVKTNVSMGPMRVMDGRLRGRELALTIAKREASFLQAPRNGKCGPAGNRPAVRTTGRRGFPGTLPTSPWP